MTPFTPFHSSIGGALLGVTSAAKLTWTGRILGISGTLRGLLRGNTDPWRLSFLGGLAGSGLAATVFYPSAFQAIAYSHGRAALSGWLVGVGSSLGNGCTSGHGICGNARFSLRSFAYTCVFMVAGVVTATLSKTAEALGVVAADGISLPTTSFVQSTTLFALFSLLALALPSLFLPKKKRAGQKSANGFVDCLAEGICGAVFGSALCLSGMTLPSKVAAFLSPLHRGFDPSLICVMGAALLIATPIFNIILRRKAPLCTDRFEVPTNRQVDAKLLTGGLLFGSGWGLGGICPGPAIVSLSHGSPQLGTYLLFLSLGLYLEGRITPILFERRSSATAK